MLVNIVKKPCPFPRPTLTNAIVLKRKDNGKQVVVLLCPTPSSSYCLFVGDGVNSYLPESAWDKHTQTHYDLVHEGPIHTLEITFNA